MPLTLENIRLRQFISKFAPQSDCGCSCDCVATYDIYASDVERAGGYEEFIHDFKALGKEGQLSVAPLFREDVAYHLLSSLDPKYSEFRQTFDNGTGVGNIKQDDRYANEEIIKGGGYFRFREEIEKLAPLVSALVFERLAGDVSTATISNNFAAFWQTYNNGGMCISKNYDVLIDKSEIDFAGGWDNFYNDIKNLSKSETEKALNALVNIPPPIVLHRLVSSFPEYMSQYNLKQFPNVSESPYGDVHKGLAMIEMVTGTSVPVVSQATLPPPIIPLAASDSERFYLELYEYLQRQPSDYQMGIWTFSKFVENFYQKNNTTIPHATMEEIYQALYVRREPIYDGLVYEVKFKGKLMKRDKHLPRMERLELKDSFENEPLIKRLMKAGLRGRLQEKDGVDYYVFEYPASVKTSYSFSTLNFGKRSNIMPLDVEVFYSPYKVIAGGKVIVRQSFNGEGFLDAIRSGRGLPLKIIQCGMGDWSLELSEDFINSFITTKVVALE